MIDLKKEILDRTRGGLDILLGLFPDARSVIDGTARKFKMRPEERTASATIRQKDGVWYVCDFGDDGREINCFDAYMKANNIAFFSEAIHQLAERYGIQFVLDPQVNRVAKKEYEDVENDPKIKEGDYGYTAKEKPSDADLKVWGAFVTPAVLDKYNYKCLVSYWSVSRSKTTGRLTKTTYYSSDDFPIFLHDCGKFCKIYRPFNCDKYPKFTWHGSKPKDYINGWEEAKRAYERGKEQATQARTPVEKLPAIILCSGERDAMNVAGMGYYPVWLNSETATLSEHALREMNNIAKKVYNVPDIDQTGIERGTQVALTHLGIYTIELPKWLSNYKDKGKPRKDLRDFLEIRPSKAEFEKLMDVALQARFWDASYPERNGRITENIQIRALNLLYFLRLNGFYKIQDPISKEMEPCRVTDYMVEIMKPGQIRDFIREDLQRRQVRPAVIEAYIKSKTVKQDIYNDLQTIEVDFTPSTPTSRTFYFNNGCLVVTKDDTQLIKPKDKRTYYYKEKVIPHTFKRLAPSFQFTEDHCLVLCDTTSKMFRYLINGSRFSWQEEFENRATGDQEQDAQYIADNRWTIYGDRLTMEEKAEQARNLLNKIYALGYLLHQYKTEKKAFCIYVMEGKLTKEDVSQGGSGKSLFARSLKKLHIANMVTLDGRKDDMTKNNHYLDRINRHTDILLIDDAAKNFPFDAFYTGITGDMIVNPKGTKSFEIEFENSPMIVFTSNFPWQRDDESTRRRILPVVFSDYYHGQGSSNQYRETRKVSDDFDGQELFGRTYPEEDFNADYNFLIDCLQFYLSWGGHPIEPPMERVMARVRRGMMGDNFVAWADTYFAQDENEPNPKLNHVLIKQSVYNDFCDDVGRDLKKTAQSFKQKLKIWCQEQGYEFCPKEVQGYKESMQRITRNIYSGTLGNRKSVELIYIRTSPDIPIDNTLPQGWYS